jgi:hypothetical protein
VDGKIALKCGRKVGCAIICTGDRQWVRGGENRERFGIVEKRGDLRGGK